jgi:acetyl esterase/lipase
MRWFYVALIGALALIAQVAEAASIKLLKESQPTSKVVYKTINDVKLRLHIFEPSDHSADDERPAAVFFFGGGWVAGTPKQFYPQCAYLASRGMWAAAAEYRVRNRHQTPPKACVEDGKSAVRWVRRHADALGIDPHRLAAGGGSAGGHVAAATATLDKFNAADDPNGVSCKPDALLLYNPVYDNGPKGYGHKRVKDYWRDISPLHNLDKDMPPTITFLGTKDHLIPVATGKRFQKKMQALGVRSELRLYDGAKHGFFNPGRAGGRYFYQTTRAMDRFLESLNWLEGEPTLTKP